MARVTRSRLLRATPEVVWAVLDDPYHLPRWWPRVERVESVDGARFTTVLYTERGRPVRADWELEAREPLQRRRWRQLLAGTPFERILSEAVCEARLTPHNDGTRVTLELRQQGRGLSRLGGPWLRRAARLQLDGALARLEEICG